MQIHLKFECQKRLGVTAIHIDHLSVSFQFNEREIYNEIGFYLDYSNLNFNYDTMSQSQTKDWGHFHI